MSAELQQIREALGELTPLIADIPGVLPERARLVGVVTDALAALARVEATLNEAEPLPANTVCACLDETGSRQVRVYERCELCHALMESGLPADLAAAEARVVAAEAERDEWKRQWKTAVEDIALVQTESAALTEGLASSEAARMAAEAELAKRDNRLEMVRENLRHIAVSLPRAPLRQKLEDLAALSTLASATGASGALQNPARPAPTEPPPEPTEGVALTPEQILHVQRKTLASLAPAEPPEHRGLPLAPGYEYVDGAWVYVGEVPAEPPERHECQRCGSTEWTGVDYSGCSDCREPAEPPERPETP